MRLGPSQLTGDAMPPLPPLHAAASREFQVIAVETAKQTSENGEVMSSKSTVYCHQYDVKAFEPTV